tara:strand:- start:977 stop:1435 length:459 start_codon:yes stop_codon:yes gene_type:complete
MAKTNAGLRIRSTRNPFKDMSMADMKKKWSKMSPEERAANVQTFRDAAKSAPKSKPKASKPAASKPKASTPAPKPTSSTPQPKPSADKPKPSATPKSRRRGAGVRNGRNRIKNQMKIVKKALSGLTHKKGDTKKVNGITYVHNGKRFVRYTM